MAKKAFTLMPRVYFFSFLVSHKKLKKKSSFLDLIFTVESLKFLRDAADFWKPYCVTVIQRLGYVCKSWNSQISRNQLKASDFLTVVEDIGKFLVFKK